MSAKSVYSDIIRLKKKTTACENYLQRKRNKIVLFVSLKLFPKMGVCIEKILAELTLVKLNRILKRSSAFRVDDILLISFKVVWH